MRGGWGCPTAAPGRVAETRDHEWVSSGQADVSAQLGGDDLNPAAGSSKSRGRDLGPRRTEESFALGVRDRAADHDPGWVEGVDEADAGDGEGATTALHDRPAGLVPGVLAVSHVAGLERADPLPAGAGGQIRTVAGRHGLSSEPGHGRAADESLQVTDGAATAQPLHRHWRMPELAGRAVGSMKDTAVGNDGSSDACRDGQVDEVGATSSSAKGHLAQGGDVGVTLEEGGQPEGGAKLCRNWHVHEVRAHVRRLQDHSAPRIEWSGSADADADDPIAALSRRVAESGAQRCLAIPQDRGRTIGHGRQAPGLGDSRPIVEHDGRANVRAADVEREDRSC